MKKKILIICGIFINVFFLLAQEKYSKEDLVQMMNDGRYEEAYSYLEMQYQKFPKDPDYLYLTGLCRVQLSQKVPEAIPVLMEATKQNTHKESWYYLGKAYLLNFEFNNALEAFDRFNDKATRLEKEKLQLPMYISMCRNSLDICSRSKKITVVKIDTVTVNNLFVFLNKQLTNGRIERVGEPSMFSSKINEGVKFSGNKMLFLSKVPFGKKYKDIFIAQDDDIDLDKYKSLGSALNSAYEEEFVYYDETVPALYFSSQGHNSGGGFDIFKSYYDKTTDKWSAPVNLGFPVNTPFDEVAYVTIPGTNKSLLATNRYSKPGKLVVYTIENGEDATEESILSSNAAELANLKLGKLNLVSQLKKAPVNSKTPVKASNEAPSEIVNEQSYQRLIHEALNLQIRSDSVKRISDEKKELLITSKFESDKTRLWQEIKVLDARAEDIQQKADVLYKKARDLEAEKQKKSVNTNELAQKAFANKSADSARSNNKSDNKKITSPTDQNSEDHPDIQYRIQVGVFSKQQSAETFKGFSPVLSEKVQNGNAFKYYLCLYKKLAEAEKGLVKVKGAGFKDAYIIGFYKGKVVPLSRAIELELSAQKR